MPRLNSFHLAAEAWPDSGRVTIAGGEAHHLANVLRHKPGDLVRLFDGVGRSGTFSVVEASRKKAVLEPVDIHIHPRRKCGITLALGWNRSSRRDWLLEKAVEFGAAELLFWQAERSQGKVPAEPKPKWTERTVQAAKQCGAVWLPELKTLSSMQELLSVAAGFDVALLLDEGTERSALLAPESFSSPRVLAVIGPEGGLGAGEVQTLTSAGLDAVSLGESILRWETAALHVLSLAHWANEQASLLSDSDPPGEVS